MLASANATFARIHVTEEKYENPSEPPMFCMLLRKHIEGGFISAIEQDGFDRVITFTIANKDELGDRTEKQIIFEIMGRHSNIMLIDKKNQVILDSIKHVRFDQSSYRTVGPGQPYKKPPEQDKADPLDATEEDVLRKIDFNAGKLDKQLVQQFAGISPLLANEVLARAKMANRSTLPAAFVQLMQQIKEHDYTPELVRGEKEFFSIVSLTHKPGERFTFSSASQLLDRFYYGKAERDRVKQQAYDLERLLKNEYQKNVRKQKKLSQTLREADEAATYQKLGELLTANIYAIKKRRSQH